LVSPAKDGEIAAYGGFISHLQEQLGTGSVFVVVTRGGAAMHWELRFWIVLPILLLGARTTIAVEQESQPGKAATVVATASEAQSKSTSSSAFLAWKMQVYARIDQNKAYPPSAETKNEGGIVHLRFGLDRQGHLTGSRIIRSSGFTALDNEALDLLRRAQPFPPPPAELAVPIHLTLPVNYMNRDVTLWRRQVLGKLQQNFRYPTSAKNGEQGTVHLAFSIDSQGRLGASRIVRGSGSTILDKDALDLLRRTQPFPAPPTGAQAEIKIPVNYQPCTVLGALLRRCSQ
jgi:periplasmic protein TonB